MAARQPSPINTLSGEMPSHEDAMRKLRQQTTTEMPIVRVTELSKSAGDKVQVDCAHVVKLRPIMGDRNAEGEGAALTYSSQELLIDAATLPISAGGRMSRQRTPHDLRKNALSQLKGGIPRFLWQRCLAHLAGARGRQNGPDWILTTQDDPEFAEQMVNPLRAPTYNRHFVCDGSVLIQGGAQLASVDSTDSMKLAHIDQLSAILGEQTIRMPYIQIPGDPAAGDDPIKGVLLLDELTWDAIITDTSTANLRSYQTNAMERAKYGKLAMHPLFSGSPLLWNNILIRKHQYGVRFFAGDTVSHVTAGNRLTATETNVTVAAGLSTTHQVSRSLFLSAQALAMVSGGNQTSEETYSLLENSTNFQRNIELAGEIIGAEAKLRFTLPNGDGNNEVTDFGVMVIDSVVRRLGV